MQTLSRHLRSDDSSLYIRWKPERSPYTIELKLGLVKRIAQEVRTAFKTGVEVGGILIGTLPDAATPTLRIDNMSMIPRSEENSAVFLLSPREHDRILTARWEASKTGHVPVGLFRTHSRSGPLRPSLVDRTLLAGEFDTSTYLLLLIEANERRTAAFFLGSRGELADEPAVAEFRFEEAELAALPELRAETAARETEQEPASRKGLYLAAMLLILLLAGVALEWSDFEGTFLPGERKEGLQLRVAGERVLKVTWNHAAPEIHKATAAKLFITDGEGKRELPLAADELQIGSVEYQHKTSTVQITLQLTLPGNTLVSQAVTWHA